MRIAIVHPWFLAKGGAEHVVSVLADLFPTADIFTLFFKKQDLPPNLHCRNIKAISLNWLPAKYHIYRALLPLYPMMFESIDLRGYDVVISSDSCVAKGILVDQNAVHICYCHSPMRCLWDLYREFQKALPGLAGPLFTLTTHYVRQWDLSGARRVDHFVANSRNVAQRISKFYSRDSTVIYPPVSTQEAFITSAPSNFYLSVGRLTESKRVDLLIQSCNGLGRPLIVVGSGREESRLRDMAGPTVEFVGRVSDSKLAHLYANCRALLFAADEDFGLVPLEAQAHGRPVIAYGHGGSLETVIALGNSYGESPTGILFPEQSVEDVTRGIQSFEKNEHLFIPEAIQRHARKFDTSIFANQFREFVHQSTGTILGESNDLPSSKAHRDKAHEMELANTKRHAVKQL